MPHPEHHLPPGLLNLGDYEQQARAILPHPIFEYIAGGCGDDLSLAGNRSAFDDLKLYTRVLRNFTDASARQTLLGRVLRHPILLAPVAHQTLVHPQGELATAQGCDASDTPLIVSTLAHHHLEDIAGQCWDKWFQLYWQPSRAATLDLVKRAEQAGYQALVVTVDSPVTGLRYRPQRAGFAMPVELVEANLAGYPRQQPRAIDSTQSVIFSGFMADAPTWDDIALLKQQTRLPVLLKGITHPGDAVRAMELGLDGVIVSNHGGRSLDGIPATLKLLPAVRRAVDKHFPVLLDGGIRKGSDVFKALALGANAVLVGRPQLYALAVAGALGVAHMLRLLKDELEITMALAGCPTLADINENCLY